MCVCSGLPHVCIDCIGVIIDLPAVCMYTCISNNNYYTSVTGFDSSIYVDHRIDAETNILVSETWPMSHRLLST